MQGVVTAILVFGIMPLRGSQDIAMESRFKQLSKLRNRSDEHAVNVDGRRLVDDRCGTEVESDPIWDKTNVESATRKCKQCVAIKGKNHGSQKCKWCPLSQTCTSRRRKAGPIVECMTLPSQVSEDAEVLLDDECETRPASILKWMDTHYGSEWSDNKESHMDVIRCAQWAVKAEVISADEHMSGKKDVTDDDIGEWGCRSALLRAALVRLFSGSTSAIDESQTQRSVIQNWDAATVVPSVCELTYLRMKPSVACNVDLYGESEFAILRKRAVSANAKGPDDISSELLASVKSGPIVSFSPGAGKSGSGFCRSWDDRMKLKLGVKQGTTMDEPANLLQILQGTDNAESLQAHLKRNPTSLLNRYYGLLRTRILDKKASKETWTLLMQDASYEQDARVQKLKKENKALDYTRYDLKGDSRDLKKTQDEDKQFTLINGDFLVNEDDKLKMTSRQCWRLRKAMRADTAYLQAHNMIDYSIFLGVAHSRSKAAPDCRVTPQEPFCFQGKGRKYQYTFSLIDYLNDLNGYKKWESAIKLGKFSNYNGSVMDYVEHICPSNESFEEMWDTIVIFFWIGGTIVAISVICAVYFFCRCPSGSTGEDDGFNAQQELSTKFAQQGSVGSVGEGTAPSWAPPSWGPPSFAPMSHQQSLNSSGQVFTGARQQQASSQIVSQPISSMGPTGQPSSAYNIGQMGSSFSVRQPNMVINGYMGVQGQTSAQPSSQFQPRSGY